MKELTVPALVENLPTVTDFVDGVLESIGCPMKVQFQIDVVIDEIFSNICFYAYAPETGDATVQIDADERDTQHRQGLRPSPHGRTGQGDAEHRQGDHQIQQQQGTQRIQHGAVGVQ